jgi:hypothetical protein
VSGDPESEQAARAEELRTLLREVDTVLEELNAVDQITVTGSSGGPWTVTFAGTQAATDVSSIMGDATGVTNGPLLRGVRYYGDHAETHSIILRTETGTRREINAEHSMKRLFATASYE